MPTPTPAHARPRPHTQADYLAKLGVTAVELLPVFEYDELEFQRLPNPREHMVNMWGYSHIHTFSPNSRLATAGVGPVAAAREFKEMVKTWVRPACCAMALHGCEGSRQGPVLPHAEGVCGFRVLCHGAAPWRCMGVRGTAQALFCRVQKAYVASACCSVAPRHGAAWV